MARRGHETVIPRSADFHKQVRAIREERQCGLVEAVAAVERRDAEKALADAQTVDDMRPIMLALIARVFR